MVVNKWLQISDQIFKYRIKKCTDYGAKSGPNVLLI